MDKTVLRATRWNKDNPVKRQKHVMNYQWKKLGYLIGSKIFDYKDFNAMFEEQNGCCKICGLHQSDIGKTLSVDHNHETGQVRGLLCQRCNTVIGMARDNIDILNSAIDYLEGN